MRAAARIKMGYYPTPSVVVDEIKKHLLFPKTSFAVLDPCCGAGEAMAALAKGTRARTHGVELDEHRAGLARGNMEKVLSCDFLGEARISPESFSLILLNPPYDHDDETRRMEIRFFTKAVTLLKETGVMIFVVPAETLAGSERLRWSINYHLEDVVLFPFPKKEYEAFHQVVVMGRKRRKKGEWGYDSAGLGYEARHIICHQGEPEDEELPINFLPVPASSVPRTFKEEKLDPEKIARAVQDSPAWTEVTKMTTPHDLDLGRPPLPFRKGHLALLLACGLLDGVVGEGEERMVVRGYVEKKVTTVKEEREGETIVKEEESFQVAIKTLTPDGEIKILT